MRMGSVRVLIDVLFLPNFFTDVFTPFAQVLIGGVQSVTLSAREAEKRDDKARQVSRR